MKTVEKVVCIKDIENFTKGQEYFVSMLDTNKYIIINPIPIQSISQKFSHKCCINENGIPCGGKMNDHFKFLE